MGSMVLIVRARKDTPQQEADSSKGQQSSRQSRNGRRPARRGAPFQIVDMGDTVLLVKKKEKPRSRRGRRGGRRRRGGQQRKRVTARAAE